MHFKGFVRRQQSPAVSAYHLQDHSSHAQLQQIQRSPRGCSYIVVYLSASRSLNEILPSCTFNWTPAHFRHQKAFNLQVKTDSCSVYPNCPEASIKFETCTTGTGS